MYRVLRTWKVRDGTDFPVAIQWAAEVTSYVNRIHSMNLKFGFEMFGPATIHWHWDSDSIDEIHEFNAKLLQDREYWGLVNKAKGYFLDGSWKDTLVGFPG